MMWPDLIRDRLTRLRGHTSRTCPPRKRLTPVSWKEKRSVILCAGDSITAGSYPSRLQARFREVGIAVQVVNAGIPGYTSADYLRYMKSRDLLAATNPKMVLLQLGTNDVRRRFLVASAPAGQFEKNMRSLVAAILLHRDPDGKAPLLLLATVPPVRPTPFAFTRTSAHRVVEEINPAIRRLAEENALPLVDNFSLFTHHPDYLSGIHPNEEGYRALADNWYRAIREMSA